MSVRLRLGPFSISSRGRVGVRAGPVSVYGGGHRRKRRSTSNTRSPVTAEFKRQMAEGDRWFKDQAAAKRWAAIGNGWHAVLSSPARVWRRFRK